MQRRGGSRQPPKAQRTSRPKARKAPISPVSAGELQQQLYRRTRELDEALEQQAATAEILKLISSSPTDTQPVFEAIVRGGLKLFPDAREAPAEFATGAKYFLTSGYRAITIMPMMRGGDAIGALSVVRSASGGLSDKQIAILRTSADQAVIAIENTRLVNELRQRTDDLSEALEQQTATA